MMRTGYWVDLAPLNFADGENLIWAQALPLGTYKHPLYGDVVVTPERVQRFASNIKDNVREIDLDVNYDHREHTGKAAGWIRDAEDRGLEGLWLQIEFTEPARDAVKKGEYRYMSSEFTDEWEHPKTGDKHQDVFYGAALTNRPWLKDILPINMSEVTGGEKVDEFLKALRTKLKLSEDATEDQILEALTKEPEPEKEPVKAELSESDRELLKKLGESNPALDKLMRTVDNQAGTIKQLGDDLAQQKAATLLAEINHTTDQWKRGGSKGKFAIPPAALENLPVQLAELPPAGRKVFADFVASILDTGLVELQERGRPAVMSGKTAGQMFTERADKMLSENKNLSYADAVSRITAESPELWEAYRSEVLDGTEVNE
jgi:phage I-like protein